MNRGNAMASGDLHGDGVAHALDAVVRIEVDQRRFECRGLLLRQHGIGADDDPVAGVGLVRGRPVDGDDAAVLLRELGEL